MNRTLWIAVLLALASAPLNAGDDKDPLLDKVERTGRSFVRALDKYRNAVDDVKDAKKDLRKEVNKHGPSSDKAKDIRQELREERKEAVKALNHLKKTAEAYHAAEAAWQNAHGRPFNTANLEHAQGILNEGATVTPGDDPQEGGPGKTDERGIPEIGEGEMVSADTGYTGESAGQVAGLGKPKQGGGQFQGDRDSGYGGGSGGGEGDAGAADGLLASLPAQQAAAFAEEGLVSAGGAVPLTGGGPQGAKGGLIPGAVRAEKAAPRGPASDDLDRASSLIGSGNYLGALGAAEKAISLEPFNPRGYLLKARALNRLGKFQDAVSAARIAVKLAPKDPENHIELAWSLLQLGKYDEAVAAASEAIRLDPKNAKAYALRAFAFEQLNKREQMLADLRMAAKLDPERYAKHLALAERGVDLFEPGDKDSYKLLEGEAPAGQGGGVPWVPLLGALGLLGAGAGAFALGRGRFALRGAQAASAPAAAEPAAAADGTLAGKYRLVRVIGRGGMGEVHEAVDESLGRPVAVKRMTLTGELGTRGRALYLQEARTVAQLHHPNIVDVFEIVDRPDGIYIVFEFVGGKTVAQALAEKRRFGLPQLRAILGPVCAALDFAHGQGVVHRDLKPANIMIGERMQVKLMDFGIARGLADAALQPEPVGAAAGGGPITAARTRTLAGTPEYMAPEAMQGLVSPALDVYGLGVCAYEMAAGRRPGAGAEYAPPSTFAPELPPGFDELVARALAPDPSQRPASAGEFARQLSDLA